MQKAIDYMYPKWMPSNLKWVCKRGTPFWSSLSMHLRVKGMWVSVRRACTCDGQTLREPPPAEPHNSGLQGTAVVSSLLSHFQVAIFRHMSNPIGGGLPVAQTTTLTPLSPCLLIEMVRCPVQLSKARTCCGLSFSIGCWLRVAARRMQMTVWRWRLLTWCAK